MLSVLIVDDEKPARLVLASYLREMPDTAVAGEADNGRAALELATQLNPDVVLLDVEMPGMNGIETAARLPASCAVVFVTAYDRYAIKAFELHAVDYILKPVMPQRLAEALDRIRKLKRVSAATPASAGVEAPAGVAVPEKDLAALVEFFRSRQSYASRLTIKNEFEYLVISVFDISCVRVEDGLVFVYSRGLKYRIETPLKKLEERLDPAVFLRIHRAVLVNKNHIKRIFSPERGRFAVETSDRLILPVSRDYLASFKTAMGF